MKWVFLLLVGFVACRGLLSNGVASAARTQSAQDTSAQATQPAPAQDSALKPAPEKLLVPSGTRLPLILHNAITTRNAKPGDPIYLETLFPVVINDRILIPAGSYVQGEIEAARRPGKVKGTGEIRLRLNTMILPNGYTVNFNAFPTNAGTGRAMNPTDSRRKCSWRHRIRGLTSGPL